MKVTTKFFTFLLLILITTITSCREEEFAFEGVAPEQSLSAGSNVANLLVRTSFNDGSKDNIIDQASCISLQLPVNVLVNGTEVMVNTEDDFDLIEDIFEQNDDDTDSLVIVFPVTIIFPDFSDELVFNANELEEFVADCSGENQVDGDIECIDLVYPVSISIFNSNTEEINTVTLPNDRALFNFVSALQNTDVVNIKFPISLVRTDGMELIATDLESLENHIENANGTCDEDDDNDYNDDDCSDCDPTQLENVFASCTEWVVDGVIRNDTNLTNVYTDLSFSFQFDGTLVVNTATETLIGNWTASGSGNLINVEISVEGLDDFNGIWLLNEIASENSQGRVIMIIGEDVLRFDNACLSGNGNGHIPQDVSQVLTDGSWTVDSFMEGDTDRTVDFNAYVLTFDIDGNVIADNSTPTNGTWNKQNGSPIIGFDFGMVPPIDQINKNWRIVSISDTNVELSFIDPQDFGRKDTLVLGKQ